MSNQSHARPAARDARPPGFISTADHGRRAPLYEAPFLVYAFPPGTPFDQPMPTGDGLVLPAGCREPTDGEYRAAAEAAEASWYEDYCFVIAAYEAGRAERVEERLRTFLHARTAINWRFRGGGRA